ncbi:MAG: glycosyltransferase family 39 protein [Planctomycetota bacterium]
MSEVNKKVFLWFLNLSSLAVFAGLLLWSLTGRQTMLTLFSRTSYYLTLLMLILWTLHTTIFLKEAGFSVSHLFRNYWLGIMLAFALTVFVFASVKVCFKTLSDETNMVSVSGSMTRSKTVLNCTMAKYYYGNLQPINQEVDKRPLVFPFLVSVLHTISGFRYQNAFAVNFIVMFLFLTGVYIATRKLLDAFSAAAAILFILSYPVFTVFGTSAGFDVLNSAFFIMVLTIAYYFVKSPSSSGFALLFVSLLVFANIRYESIVFLLLIPLLLAPKIKWQYVKDSSFLFAVTPLINLPYLWQRILKPQAQFESVRDVSLFSFGSLIKNTTLFFTHIIDFNYILPYAGFVTLAGILIFIYLIIQTAGKKILVESHQRHFLIIFLVSIGLSTLMYFSHFMGDYTHPSTTRFFIILSIVFALSPVMLRVFKPRVVSGPVLSLIAIVCFVFYHPIAVEGRFINTLTLNRQTSHCIDFLKKLNDKNILVISSRPGQYVALGYGAVDFDYANKNKESLLNEARRHLYSKIIVFQEIMYDTGMPGSDTALDTAYHLKRIKEIQITAESFLRISEVLVINK